MQTLDVTGPVQTGEKKPVGRPATGRDSNMGVRIPTETRQRILKWADRNGFTFSQAVRFFIEVGLRKDVLPRAKKRRK